MLPLAPVVGREPTEPPSWRSADMSMGYFATYRRTRRTPRSWPHQKTYSCQISCCVNTVNDVGFVIHELSVIMSKNFKDYRFGCSNLGPLVRFSLPGLSLLPVSRELSILKNIPFKYLFWGNHPKVEYFCIPDSLKFTVFPHRDFFLVFPHSSPTSCIPVPSVNFSKR